MNELVARLNRATARREDSERGTREFREAEAARRRYRTILLDDRLFEQFIQSDPAITTDPNGKDSPGPTPRRRSGRPTPL